MAQTIQARYEAKRGSLSQVLDRARWCAKMSLPYLMTDEGFTPGNKIPNPNTSLGGRGVVNVAGKMRSALYDDMWFELDVDPRERWAMPPAHYQGLRDALFIEEVKLIALLESQSVNSQQTCAGFQTSKRRSLTQLVATGSTLESLGMRSDETGKPDFALRVYNRDQYVTFRDPYGFAYAYGVKEQMFPSHLTPEQLAAVGIAATVDGEEPKPFDTFLIYEYQPATKKWVWRQEANGKQYNEGDHNVARMFGTEFEMEAGGQMGRGLIELCAGDLSAYDDIWGYFKDWCKAASKLHPAIDASSNIRASDLEKPSGEAIMNARVEAGQVSDVGFININKLADFKVVIEGIERLRKELGTSMLMEAESAPTGEAGRHSTGWKIVAEQLQGLTGGVHASIADENQIPTLRAAMDIAVQLSLFDKKTMDRARVVSTSGLEALGRKKRLESHLGFVQLANSLGPNAMARIDEGVLMRFAARQQRVDEPGVVRTDAQMQQMAAAAAAMQAKQEAASKAIDVAGNVVQAGAVAQIPQAA